MLRESGPAMNDMWPHFGDETPIDPVCSGATGHPPRTACMLRGSITALITPFRDGVVDEKAFSALVDWQIAEGIHGLVPMGTTGESPTVSHEEHRRVIEI